MRMVDMHAYTTQPIDLDEYVYVYLIRYANSRHFTCYIHAYVFLFFYYVFKLFLISSSSSRNRNLHVTLFVHTFAIVDGVCQNET